MQFHISFSTILVLKQHQIEYCSPRQRQAKLSISLSMVLRNTKQAVISHYCLMKRSGILKWSRTVFWTPQEITHSTRTAFAFAYVPTVSKIFDWSSEQCRFHIRSGITRRSRVLSGKCVLNSKTIGRWNNLRKYKKSVFQGHTKIALSGDIRSFVRGKKKWSEKMLTERFKNVTSLEIKFVINLLNNKTIILLNLAEYRLILADSAYGLVG